jgi:D-psicose/D-tagatose/L-ribulose 3-epimerase
MRRRQFMIGMGSSAAIAAIAAMAGAESLYAGVTGASNRPTGGIKFGWCGSMLAAGPDGTGIETIELLKEVGFDYVELPLSQMMVLSSTDFSAIEARLRAVGIPCEVCNNFLPASIRITGPKVDTAGNAKYVEQALVRAARLGVKVVVCGSCGSRSLAKGFPRVQAWEQMVSFMRSLDKPAADNGITIAFESINRGECNFLNLAAEGLELVKQVNRNQVKLHVDAYHWAVEKENAEVLLKANDFVRHIHLARAEGRTFPNASDAEGYRAFFHNLKKIDYRHRISIEAYSSDLKKDGLESLNFLRSLLA